MTNAEVSDKLMNDFNSANWEGWKSSVADDAKFNDVATGQKPEGADECTAYAQTWKTIYPDMKGTCNNRIESGNTLIEECTWVGTNTGEIPMPDGSKIPPTGKSVTIKNVVIWELNEPIPGNWTVDADGIQGSISMWSYSSPNNYEI